MTLVLLKFSRKDVLSGNHLIAPVCFLSLATLAYHPSSVVEPSFIVPDYGSLVVQDEGDTIFVFFDT